MTPFPGATSGGSTNAPGIAGAPNEPDMDGAPLGAMTGASMGAVPGAEPGGGAMYTCKSDDTSSQWGFSFSSQWNKLTGGLQL